MSAQSDASTNFGSLIAYVLPGYTALRGLPLPAAPTITWTPAPDCNLGGFLSGTLQAIAVGLTVSAVRWMLIDTLHHRTGLRPPNWNWARLEKSSSAFELLVHIHYRYYKFYANMVIALIWAFLNGGYASGRWSIAYALLALLFLAASRDALQKYYDRAGRLLGNRPD